MSDIANCPFCGSTDISFAVRNPSYGECQSCLTEGPSAAKPTLAIAAWNRRAPDPLTAELVEGLEAAFHVARKYVGEDDMHEDDWAVFVAARDRALLAKVKP